MKQHLNANTPTWQLPLPLETLMCWKETRSKKARTKGNWGRSGSKKAHKNKKHKQALDRGRSQECTKNHLLTADMHSQALFPS